MHGEQPELMEWGDGFGSFGSFSGSFSSFGDGFGGSGFSGGSTISAASHYDGALLLLPPP